MAAIDLGSRPTAEAALASVANAFRGYTAACDSGNAHPYGNKNFAKEHSDFTQNVDDVRQALLRYKEWCSQGQSASRLLLGLKDKALTVASIDRLSTTSQQCCATLERAEGYVACSLSETLQRLEILAKDLNLKFLADSDSVPDTVSVFIQEDRFYIEIEIEKRSDKTGYIKTVKTEHSLSNSSGEPKVDDLLTQLLRNADFERFKKHMQILCDYYTFAGDFSLNDSLVSDLSTLATVERQSLPDVRALVHTRHGLIVDGSGVLSPRIVYFAAPRTWLQLQTALETEAKSNPSWDDSSRQRLEAEYLCEGAYSASVVLEAGNRSVLPKRPLVYSTAAIAPSNAAVLLGDKGACIMPLDAGHAATIGGTYVLQLNKPLAALSTLLSHLKRATTEGELFLPTEERSSAQHKLTLAHMLCGQSLGRPLLRNVGQATHQYNLVELSSASSVNVQRVPFTSLLQLYSILNLLRQQVAFNVLIESLKGQTLLQRSAPSPSRVFEVSCHAPQRIHITCESPSQNGMFSVAFGIAEGGVVSATLQLSTDLAARCPAESVTQYIRQTLSIPHTLEYIYDALAPSNEQSNKRRHMSEGDEDPHDSRDKRHRPD